MTAVSRLTPHARPADQPRTASIVPPRASARRQMAGMVPSDLLMKRVSSPAPRGLLTSPAPRSAGRNPARLWSERLDP
eukprot:scaffold74408_cov27-Phaeocystis_antarctica.AAC.1